MVSPADILNGRVLIVDDQKLSVLVLERMLRGAGYTCVTSTTDPAAVRELHLRNRYDLILLDLQMPGMDGFRVMEGLKEIETEGYLPVLVITAQPNHKLRALKAGARDFISKPIDRAEVLIRVQNMVEVRLLHLETRKLYAQVMQEKKASERLLLNVLPLAIAERLKWRTAVLSESFTEIIADKFDDVSVLFSDLVGFTEFSANESPDKVVGFLNEIFTDFDGIAGERGLEKIKTIGDAYMAVAGLPEPASDHMSRAAHMALDMTKALEAFNGRRGCGLQMRIGIHSGPVVAGVIGRRKFIYDLWGDTVNTASRMESHGVAGRIQITESSQRQLSEAFIVEKRGGIEVKGKGEMRTWFLNGRRAAVGGPRLAARSSS
jgi:adenylate cyclase